MLCGSGYLPVGPHGLVNLINMVHELRVSNAMVQVSNGMLQVSNSMVQVSRLLAMAPLFVEVRADSPILADSQNIQEPY